MYSALENKTEQQQLDSIKRDVALLKRYTDLAKRLGTPRVSIRFLFVGVTMPMQAENIRRRKRIIDIMDSCAARAEWKNDRLQQHLSVS